MSYQPYPTGGSYQPYPGGGGQMAERPPQPSSVRTAVWLMYGGAALSAISAILVLALSSRIRSAIRTALLKANVTLRKQGKTPLTATQIHSAESVFIGIIVVILLVSIILWVWMAWANGRGRPWARIVASVLFALNTIFLFLGISRAGTSTLFTGLGWLLGLGAIILLWRRESSAYFKPGTMP
jgi:phosphoglycerol transferase MdoB-like AlkP superfamily enzyme